MKSAIFVAASLATGLFVASSAWAQAPEQTNVRFSLDWAFQGPQAVFTYAAEKGFFRQEGINVTLDRGMGSGDTVTRVASGAYDIGFGDINPMIKFSAENPGRELTAVYMAYEQAALAVMTLRRTGITTLKQLEGRKLGAPTVDAGRQMFPALVQAQKLDAAKIEWVTMNAPLRETMLFRGEVDAITGFITSGIFSLRALGAKDEDIVTFRYREFGVDVYSSAVYVTQDYAAKNPRTVAAMVRAINRGIKESIANPREAVASLKSRDQLVDVALEYERMMLSMRELVMTPYVMANGMSAVREDKLANNIRIVNEAFDVKNSTLTPGRVYTDRFLPPQAERMLPQLGS
jgi:NitT/TauT family transport system substrate-binding protein